MTGVLCNLGIREFVCSNTHYKTIYCSVNIALQSSKYILGKYCIQLLLSILLQSQSLPSPLRFFVYLFPAQNSVLKLWYQRSHIWRLFRIFLLQFSRPNRHDLIFLSLNSLGPHPSSMSPVRKFFLLLNWSVSQCLNDF